MKFSHALFLCTILFAFGCKKSDEQNTTISGVISDAVFNTPLANAKVVAEVNVIQNGVFNTAFNPVAEVFTDGSGAFSLSFDKNKVAEVKLVVSKATHFNGNVLINTDNLSVDQAFAQNVSINPRAELSVRLFNETPFNQQDKIEYRNLNASFDCNCCDNTPVELVGFMVDSILQCELVAGAHISYAYSITKNEETTLLFDSVFIAPNTVNLVEIAY